MRWELTSELSALEKLEILEKEWLPIVIERSYQEAVDKIKIQEALFNLFYLGILPVRNQHLYEKKDEIEVIETFEEYLQKRPLIMEIERIKNRCIL